MGWSDLADMEMDDEASMDAVQPIPMPTKPQYPYGLRLCLTHNELAKLNLEPDCNVGDEVDLRAIAVVTCVTKTDGSDGQECRVELQIQRLSVGADDTGY